MATIPIPVFVVKAMTAYEDAMNDAITSAQEVFLAEEELRQQQGLEYIVDAGVLAEQQYISAVMHDINCQATVEVKLRLLQANVELAKAGIRG